MLQDVQSNDPEAGYAQSMGGGNVQACSKTLGCYGIVDYVYSYKGRCRNCGRWADWIGSVLGSGFFRFAQAVYPKL